MPMTSVNPEEIRKLIAEHCYCTIAEATDDAKLICGLGLESLEATELVMAIEDLVGFDLPEYTVVNCYKLTVGGLIAIATTKEKNHENN